MQKEGSRMKKQKALSVPHPPNFCSQVITVTSEGQREDYRILKTHVWFPVVACAPRYPSGVPFGDLRVPHGGRAFPRTGSCCSLCSLMLFRAGSVKSFCGWTGRGQLLQTPGPPRLPHLCSCPAGQPMNDPLGPCL